jgi:hypothetical protein
MKNQDLFEIENTILTGCKTKHWALVKPINQMLSTIRALTGPMRDSLKPFESVTKFRKELELLRATCAPDKIDAEIMALVFSNPQAQIDALEQKNLEADMLDDVADVSLEPIAENLFHDAGTLRIEPEAYFVFSKFGLIKGL